MRSANEKDMSSPARGLGGHHIVVNPPGRLSGQLILADCRTATNDIWRVALDADNMGALRS